MKYKLPAGLVYHCEACGIAIPSDAPRPELADCATVARRRFGQFDPHGIITGQFTQAAAAWALIHHDAIHGEAPHPESVEYHRQFKHERKAHFAASAARAALTPEQVQELTTFNSTHPHRELRKAQDRWLLED